MSEYISESILLKIALENYMLILRVLHLHFHVHRFFTRESVEM